jgi:hypothetical protein
MPMLKFAAMTFSSFLHRQSLKKPSEMRKNEPFLPHPLHIRDLKAVCAPKMNPALLFDHCKWNLPLRSFSEPSQEECSPDGK